MNHRFILRVAAVCAAAIAMFGTYARIDAQTSEPEMLDSKLAVRTVVSGLNQPTTMAFVDDDEFLILEKATGKVQHIKGGVLQNTVLDLAVNAASERGLLGIALHRDFAENRFVYLYWTESSTGADSIELAEVPLLGNRVDRYVWSDGTLTWDMNIIRLRAYQADEGQPLRGNHDGGVMAFGPDGKLYIFIGDVGRRGHLQNNTAGPSPDDSFGGPEPDDAHFTGVIIRLNDNGSTPVDNPFFDYGASVGGEAGANLQKVFAYGLRNSFGMAFDRDSGELWLQENGDDAFDEINRVRRGMNGGWVQIIGPVARIADYKEIELARTGGLQQVRWPPSNIADTPDDALSRLYMLPGAQYHDPEFAWKFAVAPAGIGFMNGGGIGPSFDGDLFLGASRTTLAGGYLFRVKLTGNRSKVAADEDVGMSDRVADNIDKFDITESEPLLIGQNFGVGTDIETGPNGNLFVVSLSNGAVYEIFRAKGSGDLVAPQARQP